MTVYLAFGNRTYRNGRFHGTWQVWWVWFKYKECSKKIWDPMAIANHMNVGFNWTSHQTKSGWWLTYPSEKYDFVSWKDDIPPYIMESHEFHVPNHQSVNISSRNLNSQCQASTTIFWPRFYGTHLRLVPKRHFWPNGETQVKYGPLDQKQTLTCGTHWSRPHAHRIWLVVDLPLWKMWVRQWEGWHAFSIMEN